MVVFVSQMINSRSWWVSLMLTHDGNAVNQLIDGKHQRNVFPLPVKSYTDLSTDILC